MPELTEILIVGAGPVGLTAALELKRRGFNPVIIDDDGVPTPESRALAIHPRTLEILEPANVSKKLIAAGNQVTRLKIFQDGCKKMELDFSELPHRFPYILVLPQSKTEEILIDALAGLGTNVRWHNKLTAIEKTADGFICNIVSSGKTRIINTKILIGSDGAHSLVRKSLGFSFDGNSIPGDWSLADVTFSKWPHAYDCAVANINNGKITAFFPIGQGYGRLVSPQPEVTNNLPADTEIADIGWQSGFKISYRQVATYQKDNAFLAGDAAHIHSPVGGRGMNLGIEDAAYLAWLIETGKTPQYSRYRHSAGRKVLKFTKQQTSIMLSGGWKRDFLLRYLVPLAMSFKYMRKKIAIQITGLDTPTAPWLRKETH